jgi:UDP-glucuronate decarboxylase
MTKSIVVTGGAGFVGSHLCTELIAQGNFVVCIDNLYTGSTDNIKHLLKDPNFSFLPNDILHKPIILHEVDEIYNLACPASPIHYQRDPIKTAQVNFIGASNMLELAKDKGAKILQASTSEVYGDPIEHPQTESYWGNVNPNGIRSCYDEGKRIAETLFFDYHRMHNVRIKVARIFNTYGPRMHPKDGRVVSNFIVQALQNKPLTVYGRGQQTRSFCYVDDLVEGLIKLMATEDDFTGPVNLGNPSEFTIYDLAKKVIKLTGALSGPYLPQDILFLFCTLPQDDPKQRKPDISLAKEKLGWEPKVELDEGLKHTIEYFSTLNLTGI